MCGFQRFSHLPGKRIKPLKYCQSMSKKMIHRVLLINMRLLVLKHLVYFGFIKGSDIYKQKAEKGEWRNLFFYLDHPETFLPGNPVSFGQQVEPDNQVCKPG